MKSDFQLLDLISKEKLEELIDRFTDATGVSCIITNVDGTPLTKPFNFTPFCRDFCRSTKEGQRKCHLSDQYGGLESASKRKFVIYECFNAGLLDCASPIIVDDYHIATVLMGQVLEKKIENKVAIRRAKAIGIKDIDGYIRELKKIPIVDRKKFIQIAGLMESIARTLGEIAMQQFISMKRSRQYLYKVVNSVSDGIIATDGELYITMVNNAGTEMLGSGHKKIIGKPLYSFFQESFTEKIFQEIKNKNKIDKSRFQLTMKSPDGVNRAVQLAISRLSDKNKIDGFVAVFRDISEEKKMEKMKEDLVGMLTHDMGNPIISIQSAHKLLIDQCLGELNETQLEILSLALETGTQLYGIVTDFLDIYRSENGQFLLRKSLINIESVVKEGISLVKLFAIDKKITIDFVSSSQIPKFMADYTRVLRTCVNILDNAVKFSSEESSIKVSLKKISSDQERKNIPEPFYSYLDKEAAYVKISITDFGSGIPEEYHRSIFNKFFKISNREIGEIRKGTGLGLAYCLLVIYTHNGFIWVESPLSVDGKNGARTGCRFNFLLPIIDHKQSEK
jgi:PAS domain S-box-containing protein